jgi:hypothetical protein
MIISKNLLEYNRRNEISDELIEIVTVGLCNSKERLIQYFKNLESNDKKNEEFQNKVSMI